MDSTSNQADAYLELILPHRADLLKQSIALAHQIQEKYPGVTFEELTLEIAVEIFPFQVLDAGLTIVLDGYARISHCTFY